MSQQFKAMRRPLEGAPRQPGGRPLHGFKRIPDALTKMFAENDFKISNVLERLDQLEKGFGIKPEART